MTIAEIETMLKNRKKDTNDVVIMDYASLYPSTQISYDAKGNDILQEIYEKRMAEKKKQRRNDIIDDLLNNED